MFSNRASSLTLASAFVISACGSVDNDPQRSFEVNYTSVSPLSGRVNHPVANDAGPEISSNGLELYFHSDRPGGLGGFDLYVSLRATTADPWGSATNLSKAINTGSNDLAASISEDGLTLIFASDRPGGVGVLNLDLYMSTRPSLIEPWTAAVNLSAVLGSAINTAANESDPDITANQLRLYYICDLYTGFGGDDLHTSTRASVTELWGVPANLGVKINSLAFEAAPELASDELSLYFYSTRAGGPGLYNIWRVRRDTKTAAWSVPELLPAPLNSKMNALDPGLSHDWRTLYFATDIMGNRDIWQAVP